MEPKGKDDRRSNKNKSEAVMTQEIESVLAAALHIPSPEMLVINGKTSSAGATAEAQEVAMMEILIQKLAWSGANVETLVAPLITKIINNYAYSRGQTTTVTAADIFDYIEAANEAHQLLLHMWRSQNVKNLKDSKGVDISEAFKGRMKYDATLDWLNAIRTGVSVEVVAPVLDGNVPINNAAWAQDWLSEIPKLKMPRQWIAANVALFSGFYRHDPGNGLDAFIKFVPDAIGLSNTAVKTAYDAAVLILDGFISAHPELEDILETLGFTSDPIVDFDFTRDLKGQTGIVFDDPTLALTLVNSHVFYPVAAQVDADLDSVIYLPNTGDMFNFDSQVNIDLNTVFHLKWMRYTRVRFIDRVHLINSAGASSYRRFGRPDVELNLDEVTVTSMTAAQLLVLERNQAINDLCIGLPSIGISLQVIQLVGGEWTVLAEDVSSLVAEGGSSWIIPLETYLAYETDRMASFIFEGTPWRAELQRIADSFRSTSILRRQ